MNPATRKFINEFGRPIALIAVAGTPGRNVMCRIEMRGPRSTVENNMTRIELEQLRDAIDEALTTPAIPVDPQGGSPDA